VSSSLSADPHASENGHRQGKACAEVVGHCMCTFGAIFVGALHVGDEIVEICGISVQGRTVDFLQKMLVSILLRNYDTARE